MKRLAPVLAVLAVLAVLGSTVATAVAFSGRETGSDTTADPTPSESPTTDDRTFATAYDEFPDGQVVYGERTDNAQFEVPAASEKWKLYGSDTQVYYADENDSPAVGVNAPAVFRANFCKGPNDLSSKGFAGFAQVADADDFTLDEANKQIAEKWLSFMSRDEDTYEQLPYTPISYQPYELRDGTVGQYATSDVTVLDPGKCAPPTIRFEMVTVDTGDYYASLVVVRDLGIDGAMTDDVAARIFTTLQAQLK